MDKKSKFAVRVLDAAYDAIETGEPYYQPQPYALAAQSDCREAQAMIRERGLTPQVQDVTLAAIRQAATMTAHDGEAIHILSWAAQIEGRSAPAIDDLLVELRELQSA